MLREKQMLHRNFMENIRWIFTKNDGGNPYLRMLSAKTRTAQKCIQELKTCRSWTCLVNKGTCSSAKDKKKYSSKKNYYKKQLLQETVLNINMKNKRYNSINKVYARKYQQRVQQSENHFTPWHMDLFSRKRRRYLELLDSNYLKIKEIALCRGK